MPPRSFRRTLLPVAIVGLTALSACGGSDASGGPATSVEPGTTEPETAGPIDIERPTGADELAMAIDGSLSIGGDGSVYRRVEEHAGFAGVAPAGFAGHGFVPRIAPPRPPTGFTVAELSPSALDGIYQRAAELGLLDHDIEPGPEYDWCCDRPGYQATIVVDGRSLRHIVPELDPDGLRSQDLDDAALEPDDLANVAVFISETRDLDGLVGDALGEPRSYVPEQWRIVQVYDMYLDEVDVPDWPLDEPPVIGECVVMPTPADEDTASGPYLDDGVSVAVEPLLPWDSC